MSNKEILEKLADVECDLYYRMDGSDPLQGVSMDELREVHKLVKNALEAWHKATGEVLG